MAIICTTTRTPTTALFSTSFPIGDVQIHTQGKEVLGGVLLFKKTNQEVVNNRGILSLTHTHDHPCAVFLGNHCSSRVCVCVRGSDNGTPISDAMSRKT